MRNKTLWYIAPQKLEVREIEIGKPGPREVLVKVDACGVCTWDLFIFQGGFQKERPFPFYFGHEGVGTVIETGPGVSRFKTGDRLALRESNVIGQIGRGHMAEYAIQSEDTPVPLPRGGLASELWMIEPVACCINAMNILSIKPGEKVALVGCGFMGSILLQLLQMTPAARVDVYEIRPESFAYARSRDTGKGELNVYDSRDVPDPDPSRDATYDTVIEAAATEDAFRLADRLVRRGGKLGIFSWHHHEFSFDFGRWHLRGVSVFNTAPGADPHFGDCFHQAVPLMEQGKIDLKPLVTHVAAPEEAQKLYELGLSKKDGYMKGVIKWG